MPARQPATVRLRRLAGELRGLREAAGLSRDEVGRTTGVNVVTLYRIETARVRPQRRTLVALLDRYGVTEATGRDRLVALCASAHPAEALPAAGDAMSEAHRAYVGLEADARHIRTYESLSIPGLLQTEAYARAVIRAARPAAADTTIDALVAVRLRRQRLLTGAGRLDLRVVCDEAALRRQVGGAGVMAAQLARLREAGRLPNVTFQVITFAAGAHAGMTGPFVVLDFADPADASLVYLESAGGEVLLERPDDVEVYHRRFDGLCAAALSPAATARLLTAAARE